MFIFYRFDVALLQVVPFVEISILSYILSYVSYILDAFASISIRIHAGHYQPCLQVNFSFPQLYPSICLVFNSVLLSAISLTGLT